MIDGYLMKWDNFLTGVNVQKYIFIVENSRSIPYIYFTKQIKAVINS